MDPAAREQAPGPTPAPDAELDIRGEVCPYTLLRSKLALEGLRPGQVLRIVLDNETSAQDVPRGLTAAGHAVLSVESPAPRVWAIAVRKGR